ncbi:hypothetical protein A73_89 [Escherichia phage A73]|uniref:Uncharacterized protein n=1 Tax=Escherichia phage A73 TaxID=3003819 RepID=A0AAE9VY03_9CAUD|nr:hypothetical protein A73_89 [Escherichia phage A73]
MIEAIINVFVFWEGFSRSFVTAPWLIGIFSVGSIAGLFLKLRYNYINYSKMWLGTETLFAIGFGLMALVLIYGLPFTVFALLLAGIGRFIVCLVEKAVIASVPRKTE